MAETTLMKFIDQVIIIIEEKKKNMAAEGRLPEKRKQISEFGKRTREAMGVVTIDSSHT